MCEKKRSADSRKYDFSRVSNRCWAACLPKLLTACAGKSSLVNATITGYQASARVIARWVTDEQSFYTPCEAHQLISTENLHTIAPQAWVHEYGKISIICSEDTRDTLLAHKVRFNEYRHIAGYDFLDAFAYNQSALWAIVWIHWHEKLVVRASVVLAFSIADNQLIDSLSLKLAEGYRGYPQMESAGMYLMIFHIALHNVEADPS